MKQESIYFVMPAYNEEANIDKVVDQWHSVVERLNVQGVKAILAIANDGSKDSTYSRMVSLNEKYPYFTPINKENSGHGATVLYLYRHAIENGADYIFQTDSDGQTDPEEFWQMWKKRNDYDLQVGHRNHRKDGLSRIIVTKVLKSVVRLTFGVGVTDANTPFRLMNANSIKPIMDVIPKDFFLSNVAISAIAVKSSLKTRWIPISFKARQGGKNSINLRRISKIGIKAIGDFRTINKNLK